MPSGKRGVARCADSRFRAGGDGIDGLVEYQINDRFSYSSTLPPPLQIMPVHSVFSCAAAQILSRRPTRAKTPRGPRTITSHGSIQPSVRAGTNCAASAGRGDWFALRR